MSGEALRRQRHAAHVHLEQSGGLRLDGVTHLPFHRGALRGCGLHLDFGKQRLEQHGVSDILPPAGVQGGETGIGEHHRAHLRPHCLRCLAIGAAVIDNAVCGQPGDHPVSGDEIHHVFDIEAEFPIGGPDLGDDVFPEQLLQFRPGLRRFLPEQGDDLRLLLGKERGVPVKAGGRFGLRGGGRARSQQQEGRRYQDAGEHRTSFGTHRTALAVET